MIQQGAQLLLFLQNFNMKLKITYCTIRRLSHQTAERYSVFSSKSNIEVSLCCQDCHKFPQCNFDLLELANHLLMFNSDSYSNKDLRWPENARGLAVVFFVSTYGPIQVHFLIAFDMFVFPYCLLTDLKLVTIARILIR